MPIVLSAFAAFAGAPSGWAADLLPSGGRFVAGSGAIKNNGTSLAIYQNTPRGVIDWDSFSIGSGNRVLLDNGKGATLNRVTGGNLSMILGTLSATGTAYLINPQGIVVGSSGVISTGGRFVASTLDADNDAFMHGLALTLTGTSKAWVVNLGKIGSNNGDVFLVSAGEVYNTGQIQAPQGSAELAAGQRVLLRDSSSGQQVFVQLGSKGTVLDAGAISAAQISLQAADGNVFALSGNHSALRATGTATRNGHVWLVADTGTIKLAQPIDAHNADGGGAVVDTAAGNLVFCGCVPSVSAGLWNITTPSFTIGDTAAMSFARSLNAGTSINLLTTGGAAQSGDIHVAASTRWYGGASLSLAAYHSVIVNSGVSLSNRVNGDLTLRADAQALDNAGRVTNLGTIDWSQSRGNVRAFYDSPAVGGGYAAGTLLRNGAWSPAPDSAVRDQITAYQLVNSLADLQSINEDPSGTYALGRDIDASASLDGSFTPIGDSATPFNGLLDGMGHQIQSLFLVKTVAYDGSPAFDAQGLFGVVGVGGLVRDLTVRAIGHVMKNSGAYGILAGANYGTLEYVSTSGRLLGINNAYVEGGLVGLNRGTLERASSSVDVENPRPSYAGGLVGINDGLIEQSDATGKLIVPGQGGTAGGLVGYNGGAIEQSFASGWVRGDGKAHAGGLVGTNDGQIDQSYATGPVQNIGGGDAGGLAGFNGGSITQSFATGAVTAPDGNVVGGIVGSQYEGGVGNDVYWNRETSGLANAAGANPRSDPLPPATNGLSTAQMSDPASFVGWNFGPEGVWAMTPCAAHPVLAWQISHR
jgi:filamentous hemagglutinin family protein